MLLYQQQALVERPAHVISFATRFVELCPQRFEFATNRPRLIALADMQLVEALLKLATRPFRAATAPAFSEKSRRGDH